MDILLVAGGSPDEWPCIEKERYDYFIGIDRGSLYILEKEWPLDLAVGDFDSLSATEHLHVLAYATEVVSVASEKDDTDTQLALSHAFTRFIAANVTIIGATGGRLDHFLSNLWLPLEDRFQSHVENIQLKDRQNTINYYLPGKHKVVKEKTMKYLAYICLTPVTNLTLKESKYTLTNENVSVPISFASNEFIGNTAIFSFDSGIVATIQSKDR